FPEAQPAPSDVSFPLVEPTFLPIFDRNRGWTTSKADEEEDTPVAPVYTRVVTQRPDTTARPEATARSARTLPVATMPLTEVAPDEPPKRPKAAPPVA